MSFVVDVTNFKCRQDVKSDMNGVYSDTLRICTWTVEVDQEENVDVLDKKIQLRGLISLYLLPRENDNHQSSEHIWRLNNFFLYTVPVAVDYKQ